jgi:hypothetical protein
MLNWIDWSIVDWGNAPSWGAVGVALVAATFAGLSARANIRGNRNQARQLEYQQAQIEHQQKQLDRVDEDRRREQASKIGIWSYVRDGATSIRVANTSGLPVYLASIWAEQSGSYAQVEKIIRTEVIPPGDTDFETTELSADSRWRVSILFWDTQGVMWTRDGSGKLKELSPDEVDRIMGEVLSWSKDPIDEK